MEHQLLVSERMEILPRAMVYMEHQYQIMEYMVTEILLHEYMVNQQVNMVS